MPQRRSSRYAAKAKPSTIASGEENTERRETDQNILKEKPDPLHVCSHDIRVR